MADSVQSGSAIFSISGSFPFFANAFAYESALASYIETFNSGSIVLYSVTSSIDPTGSLSVTNLPIGTTGIDSLRDGISVTTDRYRYAGVRPVFWTGDVDHQVQQITFGHSNYIRSNVSSYDDMQARMDIRSVIANFYSGTVSTTAFFLGQSGDDDDTESYDGIIEPLDIRPTIPQLTVVSPRFTKSTSSPKHIVYGELAEGGLEGSSTRIEQFFTLRQNRTTPFVESGSTPTAFAPISFVKLTGHLSGTTVLRPLAPEMRNVGQISRITSFNDVQLSTPSIPSSFLTTRILGVQSQLTSSDHSNFVGAYSHKSASTDVEEFNQRIFMGTGFQYHNSRYGTDSLAFGGLMRYRRPIRNS